MFADMQNAMTIKHGKCLYGNDTEYGVKIVKWNILYGTGDYEDPPDVCDDKNIECYYVIFENLANKGTFNVRGRGFLSIKEAMFSVENMVNVKWLD